MDNILKSMKTSALYSEKTVKLLYNDKIIKFTFNYINLPKSRHVDSITTEEKLKKFSRDDEREIELKFNKYMDAVENVGKGNHVYTISDNGVNIYLKNKGPGEKRTNILGLKVRLPLRKIKIRKQCKMGGANIIRVPKNNYDRNMLYVAHLGKIGESGYTEEGFDHLVIGSTNNLQKFKKKIEGMDIIFKKTEKDETLKKIHDHMKSE
ncbi:MAG: hypothetical protein KAS04_02890 [Candidatus Aenigmarchaeota archaeon]|nr:hypothetical protein [Candidatus Aenigmarchaeota archaeon]